MSKGRLYTVDVSCSQKNRIWLRYYISSYKSVTFKIYDLSNTLVKTITTGARPPGKYASRSNAVFWNRRNDVGDILSDGTYSVGLFIDGVLVDTKTFVLT